MESQSNIAKIAYSLITLIAVVYILGILQGILVPLAFAGLLSMLLFPICKRLEQWHLPRVVAIIITLLVLVGIFVGIISLVANQISDLATQLPQYTFKLERMLQNLQVWIEQKFNIRQSKQGSELQKYGVEALKNSGAYISNILSGTSSILGKASLVPIYIFFFLYYRDFLRTFLHRFFTDTKNQKIDQVLTKIYEVVQNYLIGLFIVITIVALLNSIGLFILGIDYAMFFGVLAAFLLLIPYIGITIGSFLPILMAILTKDSLWYPLGVLINFLGVQALESNFITPYIVGSKVSINSFAAIIGLLLGGQLWGMAGLVLAIPIIAIAKVVFDHVESLKPIGYLLGEATDERPKKKSKVVVKKQD